MSSTPDDAASPDERDPRRLPRRRRAGRAERGARARRRGRRCSSTAAARSCWPATTPSSGPRWRRRDGPHRARAARLPAPRRGPGRRRRYPRQDRGRVDRRAGRALRLHRQPPDRPGRARSRTPCVDMALSRGPARPGGRAWSRSRCCSCSAGTAAASSSAGSAPGPGCSPSRCSSLLPLLVWQPWESTEETQEEQGTWQTLADFLGPDVRAAGGGRSDIEIRTGPVTTADQAAGAQRDRHLRQEHGVLRRRRRAAPPTSTLREPEEGETVALLVSDRHDNIGMDRVARAIGDAAGATAVLDAGDDTSTGQPWEAFSLDSLAAPSRTWTASASPATTTTAPSSRSYLADLGWTMLDGEVVEAPGAARCSASTTRARAGWAAGATRPG